MTEGEWMNITKTFTASDMTAKWDGMIFMSLGLLGLFAFGVFVGYAWGKAAGRRSKLPPDLPELDAEGATKPTGIQLPELRFRKEKGAHG